MPSCCKGGEGVAAEIENPMTYARPTFCVHGLRVVAFFMRWPAKEATQYILLFASSTTLLSSVYVV